MSTYKRQRRRSIRIQNKNKRRRIDVPAGQSAYKNDVNDEEYENGEQDDDGYDNMDEESDNMDENNDSYHDMDISESIYDGDIENEDDISTDIDIEFEDDILTDNDIELDTSPSPPTHYKQSLAFKPSDPPKPQKPSKPSKPPKQAPKPEPIDPELLHLKKVREVGSIPRPLIIQRKGGRSVATSKVEVDIIFKQFDKPDIVKQELIETLEAANVVTDISCYQFGFYNHIYINKGKMKRKTKKGPKLIMKFKLDRIGINWDSIDLTFVLTQTRNPSKQNTKIGPTINAKTQMEHTDLITEAAIILEEEFKENEEDELWERVKENDRVFTLVKTKKAYRRWDDKRCIEYVKNELDRFDDKIKKQEQKQQQEINIKVEENKINSNQKNNELILNEIQLINRRIDQMENNTNNNDKMNPMMMMFMNQQQQMMHFYMNNIGTNNNRFYGDDGYHNMIQRNNGYDNNHNDKNEDMNGKHNRFGPMGKKSAFDEDIDYKRNNNNQY